MPRLRALALVSLLAGASAGCSYRAGHPVLRGAWGAGWPSAGVGVPDPDAVLDAPTHPSASSACVAGFLADMGQLQERLVEARARAATAGAPLVHHVDRDAAAGLLRRSGGRGALGGRLANVCVYAVSGHIPATVEQTARVWMNAGLQGRALGVPPFEHEHVVFALPDARRDDFRVSMLNVGTKPLTFDLVFGTSLESLRLPDGAVALRYDQRPTRGQSHVSLWRGAALIEPAPGGSIVSEVVLFGTDLRLPLVEGLLRKQVERALHARATNLWGFVHQVAGKPVPALPR